VLITNNKEMEAIRSGLVILVDGQREIKDTNLTKVELGQPISISHLVTHVMSKFDTYNLDTHKMHSIFALFIDSSDLILNFNKTNYTAVFQESSTSDDTKITKTRKHLGRNSNSFLWY
jgi:hypothetical protein